MKALMCGADTDIKRSAKAGLDALFLLLLHFVFLKKHPCKYFFCITKKKVCTVLLGGQVLLRFLKKSLTGAPKPGMFFLLMMLF